MFITMTIRIIINLIQKK